MNYMNMKNGETDNYNSNDLNGSKLNTRSVNRNAMIFANIDGEVTYMNSEAQRLTGWSVKEAQKVDSYNVFKIYKIENREPVGDPVTDVVQNSTKVELTENILLVSKNGSRYEIDYKASPKYTDKGKLNRVIITFREIRELENEPEKEQEEKENIHGEVAENGGIPESSVSFGEAAANGDTEDLALDLPEADPEQDTTTGLESDNSKEAKQGVYNLPFEDLEKPDFVS